MKVCLGMTGLGGATSSRRGRRRLGHLVGSATRRANDGFHARAPKKRSFRVSEPFCSKLVSERVGGGYAAVVSW